MNSILTDLNPPQLDAVTAQEGAIMILAGAGSGKTRVLTRRLAYLIASRRAQAGEILAVTFTNKAAREMRERVATLLETDITRLWIGTFHSMGARILRQNAEILGYTPRFTILDTADQERLIKGLQAEVGFTDPFWTPARLANSLSRWKDGGLGPDDLGEEQVRLPRERERVAAFYQAYQNKLRAQDAMDFGDLLNNCLQLWQLHPYTLTPLQERFHYLLVDEYQDTNAVQYRWLQALCARHGNLCVVGDDDQSIYSWRGARLDNLLRFQEDFPEARIIRLEQNYRSTANILEAASHLISHNAGRLGKTLWTEDAVGAKVTLYNAEDEDDEARFVTRELERHCGSRNFHRAAVLVRASRQTRAFEEAFLRAGVPYRVVGGLRFLDRAEVRDLLAYLRLVVNPAVDVAFERIINVPKRGLGETAVAAIREHAWQQGIPMLAAARDLAGEGSSLRAAPRKALAHFIALLEQATGLAQVGTPVEVLDLLLEQTGYLEELKRDERGDERLGNLRELGTVLSQSASLEQFLEEAALITDLGQQGEDGQQADRVVISTLHAAKGLEFPVVFLVGLEEGLLPHKLALDQGGAEALEEERRLAYVGMTRAREQLYLTHARRRRIMNRFEFATPSRFLKELPQGVLEQRGGRVSVRPGVDPTQRRRGWPA